MAILKCKMCGGQLDIEDGQSVVECDYCGTKQTVPILDNEKKYNLFNRANRLRMANEFDKAAGIYETIVAEFTEEAEAYWGLVLCKYGIEYVDDPKTGNKIPTCHRTSFESIFDDNNFKTALDYSDSVAVSIYRNEAKEIDRLQKAILDIASKEDPFDVFICYKETAEDGQRTKDSVMAQDIYDRLTDKGYKVFFSRITLEDKLGQQYEPYIFSALNSAKVMLAIGTKYEYFNAVWVKNEWSRFLEMMKSDKEKLLIPCYADIDAYDMPDEFRNLQGQDMTKIGFIQDLIRGISKVIGSSVEKTVTTTSTTSGALTKRGYFFLEDEDYKRADEYFDSALDENPEDSKAYVGKELAGLRLKDVSEIDDYFIKLYGNKNFERAIRFASGSEKAQLEGIKDRADRKWFAKRIANGIRKYAENSATEKIKERVTELEQIPTIEAFEEIVSIYTDAYNQKVNPNYFESKLIDNAKMKADIIRILYDENEYSAEEIKVHELFKGNYYSAVIRNALRELANVNVVEQGSKEGYYMLFGTTERKRERKKKEFYDKAKIMMDEGVAKESSSIIFAAAEIFEKLHNYEDAKSFVTECKKLGANYKVKEDEQQRIAEAIRVEKVNAQIAELQKAFAVQQSIYEKNANKIFGAGAKLKKEAKESMDRLLAEMNRLNQSL